MHEPEKPWRQPRSNLPRDLESFTGSPIFKVLFEEAIKKVEKGEMHFLLEAGRLVFMVRVAEELDVRFNFELGTGGALRSPLRSEMEVRGTAKARLEGPTTLAQAEAGQLIAAVEVGRQRAFQNFLSDPWPKLFDPWIPWTCYSRGVVPPMLGGPPIASSEDLSASSNRYRMPQNFRLTDYLDAGFCAVIDGFPVVISRIPGRFTKAEHREPVASFPSGVFVRTWEPSLQELVQHLTGAAAFVDRLWEVRPHALSNEGCADFLRHLEGRWN